MARIDRKSDSQANAEALRARESAHADSMRRSRVREEPRELKTLVSALRREYRMEVPGAIHKREVDGGGTPAYSGEFAAYLYSRPTATDADDGYRWSFRAAMDRSDDPHRRLVGLVVMHGLSPSEAATDCGVPEPYAAEAGEMVLRKFWRGLTNNPAIAALRSTA